MWLPEHFLICGYQRSVPAYPPDTDRVTGPARSISDVIPPPRSAIQSSRSCSRPPAAVHSSLSEYCPLISRSHRKPALLDGWFGVLVPHAMERLNRSLTRVQRIPEDRPANTSQDQSRGPHHRNRRTRRHRRPDWHTKTPRWVRLHAAPTVPRARKSVPWDG